eukprot:366163-Chlamydomonas_euryale.AAC.10
MCGCNAAKHDCEVRAVAGVPGPAGPGLVFTRLHSDLRYSNSCSIALGVNSFVMKVTSVDMCGCNSAKHVAWYPGGT